MGKIGVEVVKMGKKYDMLVIGECVRSTTVWKICTGRRGCVCGDEWGSVSGWGNGSVGGVLYDGA